LVWDGYDDAGQLVTFGSYEVEATASTLTTSVRSSVRVGVEPSTPLLSARQSVGEQARMSRR
jgi:hypothetical protein